MKSPFLGAATAAALLAATSSASTGSTTDDRVTAQPLRIVPAADAKLPPLAPPVPQLATRPGRLALHRSQWFRRCRSWRSVRSDWQHSLSCNSPCSYRRCRSRPFARNGSRPSPRRNRLRRAPQPAVRPPRRDSRSDRLRTCLKPAARALLDRIEAEFGPMDIISTCRPGARIAGTGRISKHATGEAIDFNAGRRKGDVVRWLIANHKSGGIMTYAGMSHIHVDVGHRFVALNAHGGR